MMRRLFRTKSRVILFLAGTTACLYVLLLYYSMNRLDAVHSRSVHLHKLDSDIGRMVRRAEEEEEEALSRDKVSQQTPQTKMVRGVLYRRLHLYQPTVNDTFQCLYSKKQIPYKYLNDDYCDCDDSSDEPGTSACPSSKFYCGFQFDGARPQYTLSSRVNDGFCDCCDGSDEWDEQLQQNTNKQNAKSLIQVSKHGLCSNRCDQIIQEVRKRKIIIMEGRKRKSEYLKEALSVKDKEFYGPEGVFYKLSFNCYKTNIFAYEYTICPFKECIQQKAPEPPLSMGTHPEWEKMRPGDYILKMTRGHSKFCPDQKERLTRIFFQCGIQDGVHSIEENVCEYNVKFNTPAAC